MAWYSLAWSHRQTCNTYSTSSSMEDRHLILSISQVFCQETTRLWRLPKHTLWYMKICHLHHDYQLKNILKHLGRCYIWIWNWTKDCPGGWWMALNSCKDVPCIGLCSRYVTIILIYWNDVPSAALSYYLVRLHWSWVLHVCCQNVSYRLIECLLVVV